MLKQGQFKLSGRSDELPRRQRSLLMARVRQRGTTAELAVRRFLKAERVPFRTNDRHLPGKPDLSIPSLRLAVFVHGCFWHRHRKCRAATVPKTNVAYWTAKFVENVARDRRKARALRTLGYRVVVVWECQTRDASKFVRTAKKLRDAFGKHRNEQKTSHTKKEILPSL